MTKKDTNTINKTLVDNGDILWQGSPEPRTLFFYPDLLSSLSGFVWLFLGIVWSIISYERPVLSICISIVLLGVSLYFLIRLLSKIIERAHTRYFITENKLFVVYKKKTLEIYMKDLTEVNNPIKHVRRSGYGNIYFFADIPPYKKHSDFYLHYLRYPAHTETVNGIMNIKDADKVYKLLVEAKAKRTELN